MKTVLLIAPLALILAACATQPQDQFASKAPDLDCPAPILKPVENRRVASAAGPSPVACGMRATWHASDVIARDNRRNLAAPSSEPVT